MPLIVETGSGVSGANSFGTIAGARSYASDRGITLGTDAIVTTQLILGTDYLQSLQFVGREVSPTQALAWPRKCAYVNGCLLADNALPLQLENALYQLVIEQFNGIDLMPSTNWEDKGGYVTLEKVDVLEQRFSEIIVPGSQPEMPRVDALLFGLLVSGVGRLRTVRI